MLIKRLPPRSVVVPGLALLAVALWYVSQHEPIRAAVALGFAIGVLVRKRARRAFELGVD